MFAIMPGNMLPAIREAIVGSNSFVEVHKGEYIFFDYVNLNDNAFPPIVTEADKLRRECRGLIVNAKTGNVVGRRFHKFFNQNERPEEEVNFDFDNHIAIEKLDGSMVSIHWLEEEGRYVPFTKLGYTEVAKQCDMELDLEKYIELVVYLGDSVTCIFEYVSPTNKIVVEYSSPNLILTAIRDNKDGTYMDHEQVSRWAHCFGIKVADYIRHLPETGAEGMVLRDVTGRMMKVKTTWYVEQHYMRSYWNNELYIVQHIFDAHIDDLSSVLTSQEKEKLDKYAETVTSVFLNWYKKLADEVERLQHYSNKELALEHKNEWTWAVYRVRNGVTSIDKWLAYFRERMLTSQSYKKNVKSILNLPDWS